MKFSLRDKIRLLESELKQTKLNTENQIEADPNAPDELLQDSTGGNWLFDIKNGVLFFPDYESRQEQQSQNFYYLI